MPDLVEQLRLLPIVLPALILSATLHELAHAVSARALGDLTAQREGRITLNPIKHLDPVGSAMFLITFLLTPFPFGWAKPVPVYRSNLRSPKRDMALVALAGPVTNFLIALAVAALLFRVLDPEALGSYLQQAIFYTITINLVLAVFNMLPIPPLDGSRIVGAFMPGEMYEHWMSLDRYAAIFILVLLFVLREPTTALLGEGVAAGEAAIIAILGL